MKAFTVSQKKWSLTLTLLAVLGFNLSAPLKSQINTMDFASESAVGSKSDQLVDADGKTHEVTYIQIEREGKFITMAVIPSELEGIACDAAGSCLSNPKTLDVPFESDLKVLEAALRKSIKPVKAAPKEVVVADEEEGADLTPEEKAEEARELGKQRREKQAFASILRLCKQENDGARSKCMTDKFIAALKDKRRAISKEAALDFFNTEMRETLLAAMSSADLSTGGLMLQAPNLDLITKLQGRLPKEFNDVRKAVKDLAVEVTTKYVKDARAIRDQATQLKQQAEMLQQQAGQMRQQGNVNGANQLSQQALQVQQQAMGYDMMASQALGQVQSSIVPSLHNAQMIGLSEAVQLGYTDNSYANQVLNSFQTTANSILTGAALPTIQDGIVTNPGQNGESILMQQGNGRGTITGGTTTFGAAPSIVNGVNRQYNRDLPGMFRTQ